MNINVDEAFLKLTRGIVEREKQKDNPSYIPNQIVLNNEPYKIDNNTVTNKEKKNSFLSFASSC